jgi:hypothetical protein
MPSRKRRRPRVTMLKIRAVPLERMPKSHFFYLIRKACDSGTVPAGIRITTLNWDHRVGQSLQPGDVLDASQREELRNCAAFLFGAIDKHDVRVERPS